MDISDYIIGAAADYCIL